MSAAPTQHAETDEPFAQEFNRLRRAREWTFRALAEQTRKPHADPTGRGLTNSYLVVLANGTSPPRRPSLEIVARALEMEPAYFPEWRLWAWMDLFDFELQGLPEALANLRACRDAEISLRAKR